MHPPRLPPSSHPPLAPPAITSNPPGSSPLRPQRCQSPGVSLILLMPKCERFFYLKHRSGDFGFPPPRTKLEQQPATHTHSQVRRTAAPAQRTSSRWLWLRRSRFGSFHLAGGNKGNHFPGVRSISIRSKAEIQSITFQIASNRGNLCLGADEQRATFRLGRGGVVVNSGQHSGSKQGRVQASWGLGRQR